jgi:hypothetical protein
MGIAVMPIRILAVNLECQRESTGAFKPLLKQLSLDVRSSDGYEEVHIVPKPRVAPNDVPPVRTYRGQSEGSCQTDVESVHVYIRILGLFQVEIER